MLSNKDYMYIMATIIVAVIILIIGVKGVLKNKNKKYKDMSDYVKADYIYSIGMITGGISVIVFMIFWIITKG